VQTIRDGRKVQIPAVVSPLFRSVVGPFSICGFHNLLGLLPLELNLALLLAERNLVLIEQLLDTWHRVNVVSSNELLTLLVFRLVFFIVLSEYLVVLGEWRVVAIASKRHVRYLP